MKFFLDILADEPETWTFTVEKNTAIMVLTAVGVLCVVLALMIYRTRRIKRRTAAKLAEKNMEIRAANNKLLASINYAGRIQSAVVSSIVDVNEIFPNNFVLYRPRDIVGGDYYRALRCGRYSVMITADCTGHGIPGAMLSMLGIAALREYMVTEQDAENPGTVLDRMRTFIKATLEKSSGVSLDDGMDMTICSFDFDKMKIRYAIANQAAFIVRDGESIKLKGDSMPVGRYVREKEHFQTLTVNIEKGDMIYMFSDGLQDQLGGRECKKFLLKNLIATLVEIHNDPLNEQRVALEQTIIAWRGGTPQIDDMTMVGIRV